jgi:hypothetical protein
MTEEERKTARNWNGHFINNKFEGYDNPEYRKNMSTSVKKSWDNHSEEDREEDRKERARKSAETFKRNRTGKGKNNSMYGRSAVKENNLKWCTNGFKTIYVTEGTQPDGFIRGRKIK